MPTLEPNDARTALRLSRALLDAVRIKAAAEGSTVSDVARLLLADYVAGRTAPVLLVQELYRVRKELHAIGVNLNQLTRAAHAGALDLAELGATVHRLAAAIREALLTLAAQARWQPAPDKGARRR